MYTKNSNIRSKCRMTEEELKKAVDRYVPKNRLHSILNVAVQAEKKHEINALFIVAHAAVESGWGRSTIAQAKKNFFGFNAIDSNPGKASSYKSPRESAEYYVKFLDREYLTKGGKYYEGTTIHDVFIHYSSSHDTEAVTIANIMNTLTEKAGVKPDGFPQKQEADQDEDNKKNSGTTKMTISQGDTFWEIENKHKWEHGTLQTLNPNLDPRKLQINSEIIIPSEIGQSVKKNQRDENQNINNTGNTQKHTHASTAEHPVSETDENQTPTAGDEPANTTDPKKN